MLSLSIMLLRVCWHTHKFPAFLTCYYAYTEPTRTLSENDTEFSWTLFIKYNIKLKIKCNIPDLKCKDNATECSGHNL
jgi:hypothetical protein